MLEMFCLSLKYLTLQPHGMTSQAMRARPDNLVFTFLRDILVARVAEILASTQSDWIEIVIVVQYSYLHHCNSIFYARKSVISHHC